MTMTIDIPAWLGALVLVIIATLVWRITSPVTVEIHERDDG
jgi:hypothetical protein